MKSNTLELIHAKIHGIRMVPNYKPTNFESQINELICSEFKSSCTECADKLEYLALKRKMDLHPNKSPETKQGFLGNLFK